MKSKHSTAALVRILQKIRLAPAGQELFVQELPRNHERRMDRARRMYLLRSGEDILGHLTVGADLAPLRDRIMLFHQAYPDFGNPVLGFGEHEGVNYLLESHFNGQPASALLQQPEGEQKLGAIIKQIHQVFTAGLRRSTHEAAQTELDAFFNEVLALPHWTTVDRLYLQEVVRAYLLAHFLKPGTVHRRVTNGDFMLRNLLVDESGRFRIVDCEYAAHTHFHTEDWLRFTYWDALPASLQAFAAQEVPDRAPWVVYLCLKQLLLESRENLPQKAQADARHWCQEIRDQLTKDSALARQSFFWPASSPAVPKIDFLAQLFWLTDEGWSDQASTSVPGEAGKALTLIFEVPSKPTVHGLRFDPMNCPGIVTIHSAKVILTGAEDQVLWAGNDAASLQQLRPGGDTVMDLTAGIDAFRVLGVGADPQLYLNNVGKPAGKTMRVEVVATYAADPLEQLVSAGKNLRALHKDAAEMKALLEQRSIHEDAFSALKHQLAEVQAQISSQTARLEAAAQSNETHLAELSKQLDQQADLELKLRDAHAQLARLQGVMPERDRQIAFTREALLGHARTIDRLELLGDKLLQDLGAANAQITAHLGELRISEDQNGRLAQELAAAREHSSGLADQLKVAAETYAAVQAEKAALAEALAYDRHLLRSSEDVNGRLAQELAAAREKLLGLAALHQAGIEHTTALKAEITSLRTTLATTEQLAADTRQRLESELKAESAARRQIESTRSWRWTAWARQLQAKWQQLPR